MVYLNHQNNPNQMKTNYYILFILLLSFSFANAQSTETVNNEETKTVVSVSDDNVVAVDSLSTKVIKSDDLIIDAAKLKETIARSSSDIRIYLNRLRNVDNIKLVFPKLNKDKRA